jgi:hypothetical protein
MMNLHAVEENLRLHQEEVRREAEQRALIRAARRKRPDVRWRLASSLHRLADRLEASAGQCPGEPISSRY